jgi:hypothetical protein
MLEAEGTLLGSGSANATHLHDTMNTVAFTSASTGGRARAGAGADRARAAAFLTHFASRAARRRRKGAPGRGVVHGHPESPLWQPRGRGAAGGSHTSRRHACWLSPAPRGPPAGVLVALVLVYALLGHRFAVKSRFFTEG